MGIPQSLRLKRVQDWLEKNRLDGLLVTHLPNLRYLCGFTGSAGALAVLGGEAVLFTDSRYTIQAHEEAIGVGVRVVAGDVLTGAAKWVRKAKARDIGFESARLTVAGREALGRSAGKRVRWRPVRGCVEAFRAVKDAWEIQAMREAADLGSAVLADVLPLIKPGVREVQLAAEMEYRMRRRGADGVAFETIVAFGERTALPHGRPTTRALRRNELVLLDWGAILRGYCCDLTRTLYLGRAPTQVRRWYQAVLNAQMAAREVLRPGISAGRVDAATREILERRGLARYFTHSTGHGLGLEVHEAPRLGRGQKEKIQAGMVVTLEPGIYVENVGGIRIEDDVTLTPGGIEVLTSASREFLQLLMKAKKTTKKAAPSASVDLA